MKQEIKADIYYLIDNNGKVLLKLTPTDLPGNQVIIETEKEVFSGPVSLISFSPDLKK